MNRIDLFIDALGRASETAGEIAPWPIPIATIFPYFSDLEASDLYWRLKAIARQDRASKILKRLLIAPSVAKALLMDLIIGLKASTPPIAADERVWFVERIFDVLEEMQAGDIFCRDLRNLILSPSESQNLSEDIPWIWLGSEESKERLGRPFYRASASAKALIWSLFFYGWDDIGYEIHGPYDVATDDGKQLRLVVTDYFDLKPTMLWESMQSFPLSSMRVAALYDRSVDISVDVFCHLVSRGNLLGGTTAIYLEADGVPLVTREAAEALSKCLLERVSEQHRAVEMMSQEDVIAKYIESRYYAFRRWRQYSRDDWRPPQEVLQRIRQWGIQEMPASGGPSWEDLRKAFDPRTDFIPGRRPT